MAALEAGNLRAVQRLFSMFPAGRAGGALLVLRVCVAAAIVVNATCSWTPPFGVWLVFIGSVFLAMALIAGLLTPYCAGFACLAQLSVLGSQRVDNPPFLLLSSLIGGVLAVLGPGAFSLDAHFFGRKRLVLPTR